LKTVIIEQCGNNLAALCFFKKHTWVRFH